MCFNLKNSEFVRQFYSFDDIYELVIQNFVRKKIYTFVTYFTFGKVLGFKTINSFVFGLILIQKPNRVVLVFFRISKKSLSIQLFYIWFSTTPNSIRFYLPIGF